MAAEKLIAYRYRLQTASNRQIYFPFAISKIAGDIYTTVEIV